MKNTIYSLIERNIPAYIKTLYPNTKNIILDFFRFLETDNHLNALLDFKDNCDIDNQVEPFIDYFLSELGWNYQHPITVDKRVLISILRDLYLSKGSKKSFNVLFKLLFGSECIVDYPRNQLFTLSNADYTNDTIIITSAENINSDEFKRLSDITNFSVSITGVKSKVSAIVNNIDVIIKDNHSYLLLSIDPIDNDFYINETVKIYTDNIIILESVFDSIKINIINGGNYYEKNDIIKISGCVFDGLIKVSDISKGYINNINITNGGIGYKIGDILRTNSDSGGIGFFAIVESIDVLGTILKIKMYNAGYDYIKKPVINIKSDFGTGAFLEAMCTGVGGIKSIEYVEPYWKSTGSLSSLIISKNGTSAILEITNSICKFETKNKYKNNKGFIGTSNSIIHDSNFFQHFSYSLESNKCDKDYSSIVDDLLHPVGFVRYNKTVLATNLNFPMMTVSDSLIKVRFIDNPILFAGMQSNTFNITKEIYSTGRYYIPNTLNTDYIKMSPNFNYNTNSYNDYSLSVINTFTYELKTLDPELTQVTI